MLVFTVAGVINSFATTDLIKNQSYVTPDEAVKNVASFLSVDSKDLQADELQHEKNGSFYTVDVVKDSQPFEVKINAEDGKIVEVMQDLPDEYGSGDGETNDD